MAFGISSVVETAFISVDVGDSVIEGVNVKVGETAAKAVCVICSTTKVEAIAIAPISDVGVLVGNGVGVAAGLTSLHITDEMMRSSVIDTSFVACDRILFTGVKLGD